MTRSHTASFPCPVCGGHAGLPRHRGVRCAGFTLDAVVYCTRAEHAGNLPIEIDTSPPSYKHRRFGRCHCGTSHGWGDVAFPRSDAPGRPPIAPIDLRNEVYRFALGLLELRREARHDLTRRGLSPETIAVVGFGSIPRLGAEHQAFMRALGERFDDDTFRRVPGFVDKNGRLTFWSAYRDRDGYVVPYRDEHRRITGLQQKRLAGSYLTPAGAQLNSVYNIAGDPMARCDIFVTEGGTKSIVAHESSGDVVFAVCGQSLHADHVAVIKRLEPGRVIVCLDREENRNTKLARARWLKLLDGAGLPTFEAVWEGSDVGGPKGIDDLVQRGGRPRIRRVVFAPSGITKRRVVRAVPVAGDVEGGGSIAAARAATSSAIDGFVASAEAHRGRALLVKTPPGTGKTTETSRALRVHRARGRVVVGTNRLAGELADNFGYARIEGRGEENCERMDVVRALADDGHAIEEHACGSEKKPRCPARERCPYWAQFDRIGSRVAAAEQLFNPRFLQGGNIVIADDAELLRSMIERHLLTAETLSRAYRSLARRRREPARRVIAAIGRAVLDAEVDDDVRLPLLGARVWDHLAESARRHNLDLCELIRALPAAGTLPPPGGEDGSVLTVEDIEKSVPGSAHVLLDVLRDELPLFEAGEDFNSCLRIDHHGIVISRPRTPARDRYGMNIIDDLPLLVLEATPVASLVDHLTRNHDRLPDVTVAVALPENVVVSQYASASNGQMVLRRPERRKAVLDEVSAERTHFPVQRPDQEAAVCFRWMRDEVTQIGFDEDRVLTFGSARGSNALQHVERLHVIGRPMAPPDDLIYLAQVIHHDELPIAERMTLEPRRFGGQRFEVDVVEFEDDRVAALLRATRDDEIMQMIHRARVLGLESQGRLDGDARREARVLLHSGHPLPGLRVDRLLVTSLRRDVNDERADDAEERVRAALEDLKAKGESPTMNAIAKTAHAHKQTVAKVLGKPVHTLRNTPIKGVNHVPQPTSLNDEPAPTVAGQCAGGCGKRLPEGHQRCHDCASAAVDEWKRQRGKRTGAA